MTLPQVGNGDPVGLIVFKDSSVTLVVPVGYVSGSPLSDEAFYVQQNFARLGATPGTYKWTWGEGENQNFTLIIGTPRAAIPEPASALLLGTAPAGLLLARAAANPRRERNAR